MGVFHKDNKLKLFVCYQPKHIVFVYCCDLDEDQITFYGKLLQKTS